MSVREKIASLTADCKTQIDLDAFVVRVGGLDQLFKTEFSGVSVSEFMYEWDSRKLAIRNRHTAISTVCFIGSI
jgi:hypothetical protein